ncbi:hypothetical protein BU17DRAFT_66786 [Hysterangium stoloniferum]|nr:hypothetical protein BU17DRAFT_66786 [Hysterangium stoloniferum]
MSHEIHLGLLSARATWPAVVHQVLIFANTFSTSNIVFVKSRVLNALSAATSAHGVTDREIHQGTTDFRKAKRSLGDLSPNIGALSRWDDRQDMQELLIKLTAMKSPKISTPRKPFASSVDSLKNVSRFRFAPHFEEFLFGGAVPYGGFRFAKDRKGRDCSRMYHQSHTQTHLLGILEGGAGAHPSKTSCNRYYHRRSVKDLSSTLTP